MELRNKIVKRIEKVFASGYLTVANVSYLMNQLRLLIELNSDKDRYPTTNHYCNWLNHIELDRRKSPQIVDELSEALDCSLSKVEFLKQTAEILEIKRLVSEVKEILLKNLNDKKLLFESNCFESDEYWMTFLRIILSELTFRPLKMNKPSTNRNKFGFDIYGLQLVSKKDKIVVEILSDGLKSRNKKLFIDLIMMR